MTNTVYSAWRVGSAFIVALSAVVAGSGTRTPSTEARWPHTIYPPLLALLAGILAAVAPYWISWASSRAYAQQAACRTDAAGARSDESSTVPIPRREDVVSITAEAYAHVLAPFVPDLAPFQIPAKYHAELLEHFRVAEIDENPLPHDPELGTMRLSLRDGRSLRICWFWAGHKGRMSFSFGGVRYVTTGPKAWEDDETLILDGRVRIIHREMFPIPVDEDELRELLKE